MSIPSCPQIFIWRIIISQEIMEPTLCALLNCPFVWSCSQVFRSGLRIRLCEGRFDKELFSCRILGISKLFQTQKSFWHQFRTNSFWKKKKNSSDSYWEVSEVMKTLFFCFEKNMKWYLVGHTRLKFQFEGYWEPLVKMWRTPSDIWLVTKGLNFNLRVIENRFQSIHFICMNNDFILHEKALPADPDCLPLIRKGLIRHVM